MSPVAKATQPKFQTPGPVSPSSVICTIPWPKGAFTALYPPATLPIPIELASVCNHHYTRQNFLTCGVIVADGEDSGGPTVGSTATILQIRLAISIAFLRCRLTGRGAIISVAADGGRIAPYHLTVMAPTLEL